MKRNLDTGVEVYDNKVEKNQRHATNEKPNMYLDIFDKNTLLTKIKKHYSLLLALRVADEVSICILLPWSLRVTEIRNASYHFALHH